MNQQFEDSVFELIKRTTSALPEDMSILLKDYYKREKDALASHCLKFMLENNDEAQKHLKPLCQDTGNLIFRVRCPNKSDYRGIEESIRNAIIRATDEALLRKNSVNPITGENSGNNLGPGTPQINFEITDDDLFSVGLIMKGGGCENVSRQYSLMDNKKVNQTNLEAIEKFILDAIQKAQGYGCSPGIIGVCIGGDRETGYKYAKSQFWRKLDDVNPDAQLAAMEADIVTKANSLHIGPMGMGGDTTLLAAKIGVINRIPASFFVTISYMCWAFRRQEIKLSADYSIEKFLY